MVLLGEPAFPGAYVTARPVAVFWMHDEHGPDVKILTVPADDPRCSELRDLHDLAAHLLAEISQFFDVYKELEPGKSSDIWGWQGRHAAEKEITEAMRRAGGSGASARLGGSAAPITIASRLCRRVLTAVPWARVRCRIQP